MKIEKRMIYQVVIDGDLDFLQEALEYCAKNKFDVQHVWIKDIEKYSVTTKIYKVLAQKEKIYL